MIIRSITEGDIDICAKISVDTYAEEPWKEIYDLDEVKSFLARFITNDTYNGWVVMKEKQIVGFAVGTIIPSVGRDYFRLEDICIRSDQQSLGIGREFIKRISLQLKNQNIDAIMLNTVKEFPSYDFYLNNGFAEIEYSATMILTLR